jgi:hypothetical protein
MDFPVYLEESINSHSTTKRSTDDAMSCDLHLASLDLSPTYETLSYVWGDQKITQPIALEGYEFEVTINLHEALRRLRATAKTRIIWIDALCINQKDDDERT